MLQFDTLEQAQKAIERINRIAARAWRDSGGTTQGNWLIGRNGGLTKTWDIPALVNGKYEVNLPTEDVRFNYASWLNNVSIGLPVNSEGELTGTMMSIYPPETFYYESEWYDVDINGEAIFKTPKTGGATSINSTTVRCEARDLTNHPYSEASENTELFKVAECGEDGYIVHQMHGDIETFYIAKIWPNGDGSYYLRLYIDREKDDSDKITATVKENISLGQIIKIRAVYDVTEFRVYVDDLLVTTVDNIGTRTANEYYFWKYGGYGFGGEARKIPSLA